MSPTETLIVLLSPAGFLPLVTIATLALAALPRRRQPR